MNGLGFFMKMRFVPVLISAVLLLNCTCHAGIFDSFRRVTNNSTSSGSLSSLSQDQVAQALKQALAIGVQTAVTNLGKVGGYLDNPKVRIPMPEKLQALERGLRSMKQDKYADEFVSSMNHAAEQAVVQALPIFTDALSTMTVEDAKGLVQGGDDSATQFFRRKGEKQVQDKMLPIVKEATAKAGVTSAYKKLIEQAGTSKGVMGLFNNYAVDVDAYVGQKATDGLFKMIAEEEKRIRENPAARTTELLDKVFGAVGAKATGK
jgi:hypothetical protein